MNLSAVVLTKNEEKGIGDCLAKLKFCDEIIVIDDFSTDKTASIAKKFAAKVVKRRLQENFAKQRNFGLSKAHGSWVLFIDADEMVTEKLALEILESIRKTSFDAFYIKRRDIFLGKKLMFGEGGKTRLLRLARKNKGLWKRQVHEKWEVEGKIGELEGELLHYSCDNLRDFLSKINLWSSMHARANFIEGKKSGLVKIVFYPVAKFCQNYFLRLGLLDGLHGFVHAILMSLHSFLAWSKLWFYQKKFN